jgi:Transglutaminase-like superfamily/Coenzyme PQQ synthesis protein D (PqqD)
MDGGLGRLVTSGLPIDDPRCPLAGSGASAGVSHRLASHVLVAADADGVMLLDLRRGRYMALNPVASTVVEGVRAGHTAAEIALRLATRYQVPHELAARDAQRFLQSLIEKSLVEPMAADAPSSVEPTGPADGAAPLEANALNRLDVETARGWIVPAYLILVAVDIALRLLGFGKVYRWLDHLPSGRHRADAARAGRIAAAVDGAASMYFTRAWCLQRSLVTLILLRTRGWPAQLVLGVRRMPFTAHAWVELAGRVVNDDPRVRRRFTVLQHR